MQYQRKIKYYLIFKQIAVQLLKYCTSSWKPYRILSFHKIISQSNYNNILNKPDNYNWQIKALPDSLVVYDGKGLIDEKLTLDNTFFSSSYFNENRFKSKGIFKDSEHTIFSLDDGRVLGNYGVVYDSKSQAIVKESVYHYFLPIKYNEFLGAYKYSTLKKIDGISLLLAHTGSDGGVYHFILESLAKIFYWEVYFDKIQYFLVPGPETDWKKKWLPFFNIKKENVIWLNSNEHIATNQLLFSTPFFPDQKPSPTLISFFDKKKEHYLKNNLLNTQNEKYPEFIWFTRNGLSVRNIIWEEKLFKLIPELVSIDFAKLSILETILICRNAKLIVGPHGAAFIHLLFCQPNTQIIELFPDSELQPVYQRLSEVKNLSYQALVTDFQEMDNTSLDLISIISNYVK